MCLNPRRNCTRKPPVRWRDVWGSFPAKKASVGRVWEAVWVCLCSGPPGRRRRSRRRRSGSFFGFSLKTSHPFSGMRVIPCFVPCLQAEPRCLGPSSSRQEPPPLAMLPTARRAPNPPARGRRSLRWTSTRSEDHFLLTSLKVETFSRSEHGQLSWEKWMWCGAMVPVPSASTGHLYDGGQN